MSSTGAGSSSTSSRLAFAWRSRRSCAPTRRRDRSSARRSLGRRVGDPAWAACWWTRPRSSRDGSLVRSRRRRRPVERRRRLRGCPRRDRSLPDIATTSSCSPGRGEELLTEACEAARREDRVGMTEPELAAWAEPTAVVRALPFMAHLPPTVRNLVLAGFEERTYRFGETVSTPEDDAFVVVVEGEVRVDRRAAPIARRSRSASSVRARRAASGRSSRTTRRRSPCAPPRAPCACCGSTAVSRSPSPARTPRRRRRSRSRRTRSGSRAFLRTDETFRELDAVGVELSSDGVAGDDAHDGDGRSCGKASQTDQLVDRGVGPARRAQRARARLGATCASSAPAMCSARSARSTGQRGLTTVTAASDCSAARARRRRARPARRARSDIRLEARGPRTTPPQPHRGPAARLRGGERGLSGVDAASAAASALAGRAYRGGRGRRPRNRCAPSHGLRPRRFPFVRQIDFADCGAAALAMVCRAFGRKVSLPFIRHVAGTGQDGTSLRGIMRAAEEAGLEGHALKASEGSARRAAAAGDPALGGQPLDRPLRRRGRSRTGRRPGPRPAAASVVPRSRRSGAGGARRSDRRRGWTTLRSSTSTSGWVRPFVRPMRCTLAIATVLAIAGDGLQLLAPVLTQRVVDAAPSRALRACVAARSWSSWPSCSPDSAVSLFQRRMLARAAVRLDGDALDFVSGRLLAAAAQVLRGAPHRRHRASAEWTAPGAFAARPGNRRRPVGRRSSSS